MGYFFHLTPSRHQNIKTSLCARTKNGSVMPLFVIFRPVRKKLQLTVSFDHPVAGPISQPHHWATTITGADDDLVDTVSPNPQGTFHKTFFFFWHPFQFIAKNILSSGCLSFQASVRHIPCTKWSSSLLSTNGCYWMDYYHIMLLPWGPRCRWSASLAPGRPRSLRHLRGLAPSPSKNCRPGAGPAIFTPRKERLRMGYTVGL